MSVKQYMHPRNKYKRPPDYKQLAVLYPEFREIAIMDLTGRVRIDFKERKSLHVLTETLLKHDFDLNVNIPADKLNPAIPLRLNYILWMEDLMTHSKLEMEKVTGIDIGTGAVCIYALLLAKIYKCQVIGTEVDKGSVEHAQKCIKKNKLQDLIEMNSNRIFKDVVQDNRVYDFSMCNPPFFENEDDSFKKVEKVLPPRNAPTGNDSELKTEGGEVCFVTKMIEESVKVGDRIKIYSTMIGKKADLAVLRRLLRSKNIKNMTWTEFCQGHTTRWGLAWSFLPQNVVNLTTAPVIRKHRKSIVGLLKDYKTSITFPVNDKFSCIDDIISFLKVTAKELNIELQDIPIPENSFDSWVCRITARKRSWEHMRRKRRSAQQFALKRAKGESGECIEANTCAEETSIKTGNSMKSSDEESSDKELSEKNDPLLVCKFWVEVESRNDSQDIITQPNEIFRIWMVFENGYDGLDALHSLRQYLINKLEVREKILDNPSKT
ncbi:Putative methyltransferase METT10D [Trachymyrmex cornetzi]|uniref:U6 small nuclear RNA (adenine-(43)-N(6))-methyltransferase n=1 Tax=Trachymyrmex cornetzi TaxID=471704 RepID=A0A195E912_9HYME|nr:Putative methyltransferase METT10D [Trachymyrmex cornetzi]